MSRIFKEQKVYKSLGHKGPFQLYYTFCPVELLISNSYIKNFKYSFNGRCGERIPKPSLAFKDFSKFKKEVLRLWPIKRRIKLECVYIIGDFYIGGTIDLDNRIKAHFRKFINNTHANRALNKRVIELMMINKKIPITILSFNKNDENKFIREYGLKYRNLLNITSNFYL